jgi:hypothetical protein
MKLVFLMVFALVPLSSGHAANESDAQKAKAAAAKKKSTEMSFDDVLVQGKFQFADEAVATVEGDKVLDALLGVRTDFKDRLKKSAARH